MSGSERANAFIDSFNRIDVSLREMTGLANRSTHTFMQVLRVAAEQDSYVSRHRDDLREYAQLRNAIVHGPQQTVIAEPLQPTVDRIRSLAQNIARPPLITDLMTPRPVAVASTDTLAHAVRIMHDHDFSQLLVTTAMGLSLLNSEHIRLWLGTQVREDRVSLAETSVADVIAALDDDGLHCLPTRATEFDAISAFEDSIGRGRTRVYAVVVTNTGKRVEEALGILTPWDLIAAGARFDV